MTPEVLNTLTFSGDIDIVCHEYTGNFYVEPTKALVVVNPTTKCVVMDPHLVRLCDTPEDVALWIVAARNLLIIRAIVGSQATSSTLQWWETAWVMAQAAAAYNLPRRVPALLFSPQGSLMERVLSLQWTSIQDLGLPHTDKIPVAFPSYNSWMSLGRKLERWLQPLQTEAMLLEDTDDLNLEKCDDDQALPGMTMEAIPKTYRKEVRWALDSLNTQDRKAYHNLPVSAILDGILSFRDDLEKHRQITKFGHIGRREAVRWAIGIPDFYGKVYVPEEERKPWNVYIDVSGSMKAYASLAWSIVRTLPEGSKLFAFSRTVVEVDPDASKVMTDGGTSYEAVADHIIETAPSRVLVISDDTDRIPMKKLRWIKENVELTYVNTRSGFLPHHTFSDAAAHVHNITD